MKHRCSMVALVCAAVFAGAGIAATLRAQNGDIALESLLSFPFPNDLV